MLEILETHFVAVVREVDRVHVPRDFLQNKYQNSLKKGFYAKILKKYSTIVNIITLWASVFVPNLKKYSQYKITTLVLYYKQFSSQYHASHNFLKENGPTPTSL